MNENIIQRIEALILETDDPKDRALLLIQLEMVKSLIENTDVTKELHAEFKEHAQEEMALIIKGRFLWRVLLAGALLLQVGLGYLFSKHEKAFEELVIQVKDLDEYKVKHMEHHRMEEVYRGGPKIK